MIETCTHQDGCPIAHLFQDVQTDYTDYFELKTQISRVKSPEMKTFLNSKLQGVEANLSEAKIMINSGKPCRGCPLRKFL